jgi:hypothetical protein
MKAPAKKTAMALAPTTFAQWMQLADMMAKSSIVPTEFKDKPGDCLVAMQMGAAVGLNPFQAIQSIAVINGRPCMWGDAVLGIVMASGLCEDIDETDDGEIATCTVKRKGKPTPTVRSFSMENAATAKVYQKDRQGNGSWVSLSERAIWRSYPQRMRQMRARSWALRDTFPDVLKGLAIREEVEDYGDPEPGEPKNITPAPDLEARMAALMPREKASDTPVIAATTIETNGQDGVIEVTRVVVVDRDAGSASETAGLQDPGAGVVILAPGQPDPPAQKKTTFTVGSQVFETNGINRAQMMDLFKLYPRVAKKYGQEKAADVLKNEFNLEHRADLTEEQAERYTIRLQEMLEG